MFADYISFSFYVKYIWKKCFWAQVFGLPYCSNVTRIHLDVALISVLKIMIIRHTISEIWRVTDVIFIFHLVCSLPFYSPNSPMITWCTVPEIWCTTPKKEIYNPSQFLNPVEPLQRDSLIWNTKSLTVPGTLLIHLTMKLPSGFEPSKPGLVIGKHLIISSLLNSDKALYNRFKI